MSFQNKCFYIIYLLCISVFNLAYCESENYNSYAQEIIKSKYAGWDQIIENMIPRLESINITYQEAKDLETLIDTIESFQDLLQKNRLSHVSEVGLYLKPVVLTDKNNRSDVIEILNQLSAELNETLTTAPKFSQIFSAIVEPISFHNIQLKDWLVNEYGQHFDHIDSLRSEEYLNHIGEVEVIKNIHELFQKNEDGYIFCNDRLIFRDSELKKSVSECEKLGQLAFDKMNDAARELFHLEYKIYADLMSTYFDVWLNSLSSENKTIKQDSSV